MPKKLAITIAGAVSLGSYEAGVLFEVLDAIEQHNSDAATTDEDRILIDVLTGASAGGMTAVILAQKLLFSADEFRGPYDNPLYNVWVKRITLVDLQEPAEDEPALHSLFSSNLIETISREALLARYDVDPPPTRVRHHAAWPSIRVGVALTNLNGVAYGYEVEPGGKFVYIDYGDQLTRYVDPSDATLNCDTETFWEPLRQAAVACGAFPIAFRPQDVNRSAKTEGADYPPNNLEQWDNDPCTFTYSDGGILQNQPLGMAKNLVDIFDRHLDQECRFFLFVSPHAKDPDANDGFHEDNADYFHLVRRLLAVVVGQSGFQDWITARAMNERLARLDLRAAELKNAVQSGAIDAACLGTTSESILKLFFPGGIHTLVGSGNTETLPDARARIAKQYSGWIGTFDGNQPVADAYRDAVLAFETAAGLSEHDYMTIYGITATDSELAGGALEAFLGFFDQRFRDHDYDMGRLHSRRVLTDPALSKDGALGPIRYKSQEIRPIDGRLDGLKMHQVPHEDLSAFKTAMRKRLNQMLKEMWGPVFSLAAIPGSDLILDSILDRMIAKL
jgi:predicted acylesterase/phospholipase RssA